MVVVAAAGLVVVAAVLAVSASPVTPPAAETVVTGAVAVTEPTVTTAASVAAQSGSPPTLAYYYIWFDPTSWNRAKIDIPLAGRYSSDERSVMEEHVRLAKAAGFTGFIVSWKSTEKLDRRLAMLADVAEEQDFKLVVIYQGLDFDRNPIPVSRIADDLDTFLTDFAPRPAFRLFPLPTVILSGSWEYSTEDIAALGFGRRGRMLLLATEKSPAGVARLSGLIDGDAYYWSSVNPATYPDYQGKLDAMSAAVHDDGGLWIAPAAPGFDARLVGGSSTVERDDGQTLRTEFAAAQASAPDAIGVISWNEFSENSYIEPSRDHGTRSLQTMAALLDGTAPEDTGDPMDSSTPGERGSGSGQVAAMSAVALIAVGAVAALMARQRRRAAQRNRVSILDAVFPWDETNERDST
jgi:hypothetical protein